MVVFGMMRDYSILASPGIHSCGHDLLLCHSLLQVVHLWILFAGGGGVIQFSMSSSTTGVAARLDNGFGTDGWGHVVSLSVSEQNS